MKVNDIVNVRGVVNAVHNLENDLSHMISIGVDIDKRTIRFELDLDHQASWPVQPLGNEREKDALREQLLLQYGNEPEDIESVIDKLCGMRKARIDFDREMSQ